MKQADVHRDRHEWDQAATYYRQALDLAPTMFGARVQLGHMLKEVGDFDAASAEYERACAIKPRDADLLLNFGHLRKLQGRKSDALNLYRASIEVDGNAEAVREVRGLSGYADGAYCGGDDGDRRLVVESGFFNPEWYLNTYPDIRATTMGPLEHFMLHGAQEWRAPGPFFDTNWYMNQNVDLQPAVADLAVNPLVHYLRHGRHEGRRACPPPGVIETATAALRSVMDLEPQLYTTPAMRRLQSVGIYDGQAKGRVFEAFSEVFATLERAYDYVVCIPWLIHGGADRVGMHIARAAHTVPGRGGVLVLVCDFARVDAIDWLPSGVDLRVLPEICGALSGDERRELLFHLMQALMPRRLININSEACWGMMGVHGPELAHITQSYSYVFCRDYDPEGIPAGYADTHLRAALPYLRQVFLDNESFAAEIIRQYRLPQEYAAKLLPIRQPILQMPVVDEKSRGIKGRKARPMRVLWASRLCEQKNIPLLIQIIHAMPDVTFHVWGQGEAAFEALIAECASACANVVVGGAYTLFDALSPQDFDVFLYTSRWDGIPNVILEAAAHGLAIVASRAGCIADIVSPETGWLIADVEAAEAYVAALRQIQNAPDVAYGRREAMRKRIASQHSWAAYLNTLTTGSDFLQ